MMPPTQSMASTSTLQSHRHAAKDLTALLEQYRQFSFLRLGDGELRYLIQMQQQGNVEPTMETRASCEISFGFPALDQRHYERLLSSYEQCSYLDCYSFLPYNRTHLGRLKWRREGIGNVPEGQEGFLFEWVRMELKSYLAEHYSLFCGAEAALLRELLQEPEYREIAKPYWPEDPDVHFLQPHRNGQYLSEDLDLIKEEIKEMCVKHSCDTVFLALGGAAKILCHELSEELGIRALDIGSALRALTYSGSDGHASWRSSHNPFFFRVPLDLYLRALRRSQPNIDPVTFIAKANAQLCLDLQKKLPAQTITSDANDPSSFDASGENLLNFKKNLKTYKTVCLPVAKGNPEATALVKEFRWWCTKKGLGIEGHFLKAALKTKRNIPRPGRLWWLFKRDIKRGWNSTRHHYFTLPRIKNWKNPSIGMLQETVPVHVLTGKNDHLLTAWMLASWTHFTQRNWQIFIHDDGTLSMEEFALLQQLFPSATLISSQRANQEMAVKLDTFPACAKYRSEHPLARKIFDVPAFTSGERFLILDSDLLFFSQPTEILQWVDGETDGCLFNKDVQDTTLIGKEEARQKLGIDLWPSINSGLCLIEKQAMDLAFCEYCLGNTDITEGHIWRIEQTLFALCASRYKKGGLLPVSYEVSLEQYASPNAVTRHYVGAVRDLFYGEGLRRLAPVLL